MSAPYMGDFALDEEDEELRRQLGAQPDQQPEAAPLEAEPGGGVTQPAAPPAAKPMALTSAPAGAAVPVPPPPPPVPATPTEFAALKPQVGQFAAEWLDDPNRYLSDLARTTRAAGEARIQQAQKRGDVAADEYYASRGLTGSSYEGDARQERQAEFERQRMEQEFSLLDRLAGAETADRAAAGGFGLEAIQAGDVMGLDRYRAALDAAQVAEAQRQFGGTLAISQQQVDLRAQELQDDARLQGRSLDLQEARDLAQQQLSQEQLSQTERLATAELGQRESEFARGLGLEERQFQEQTRQFAQQFGEQVAGRLQQNVQFGTALESENARYGLDVGLRQKALDLQEQGMTMEDAYRRAALDQERELTESAQDLQKYGIDQESAYRYAALAQDATFRGEALRLQGLGMDLDEAFRRAELTFRMSQSDRDEAFRKAEAEREQDRFNEMMRIWQLGQGTGELQIPRPRDIGPIINR